MYLVLSFYVVVHILRIQVSFAIFIPHGVSGVDNILAMAILVTFVEHKGI